MRLRIGNDRIINWEILRNGVAEDFSGKKMSVKLLHTFGNAAAIDYTIEGNRIRVTWAGKDQKRLGKYMLLLVENEGETDMYTIDHYDDIELVAHSVEEDPKSECGISTHELNFSSDIAASQRGFSAYEIAVKCGFKGSEEEWLASLHGEKGDAGLDGGIYYPKYSVNSAMELEVETEIPTNRVGFDQETGELILKI